MDGTTNLTISRGSIKAKIAEYMIQEFFPGYLLEKRETRTLADCTFVSWSKFHCGGAVRQDKGEALGHTTRATVVHNAALIPSKGRLVGLK